MQPTARLTRGRRSASLVCVVLISVTVGLGAGLAAVPSMAFTEEPTLPTPPRQAEPWTSPPTSLPRFFISTTATLCEQGLADPRGCEYRKIRMARRSSGARRSRVGDTNGWVLPATHGEKARYAIAWNGLVYPLTGAGGPADLDADVRAMENIARKVVPDRAPGNRRDQQTAFQEFGCNDEPSSIAVTTLHPIKVCLLLRLGRADLAEALWAAATGRPKAATPGGAQPKLDLNSYDLSYVDLASDFVWYRLSRAIGAHARGDDVLALADVRAVGPLAQAVEAKAAAMGFARPHGPGEFISTRSYIEFLDHVPELLADQERRERERANPPAPPPGAGREAQVAALIRNLDQVDGSTGLWIGFGFEGLGQSPIVRDLIAEGDVAVEPLIQAYRTDDRLTRVIEVPLIDFHGQPRRGIETLYQVSQCAYHALRGILGATTLDALAQGLPKDGPESRKVFADRIQAYWEKHRTIPLAERWYQTLADDKAGNRAWFEAAENITQPQKRPSLPEGEPFAEAEPPPLAPGERPRLRGEPLRTNHEPTVAALMARRVESMLRIHQGQRSELSEACRMAEILADWDPAAMPTLRELTRLCRERYAQPTKGDASVNRFLAVWIARFTLARDRAGDTGAIREYAGWVRTTSPAGLENTALAALEPIYRRPDDPTLAAAAAWLFEDPQSPWVRLIRSEQSGQKLGVVNLFATPMVEVPAFRKMVLAALEDDSPAGTAQVESNGSVIIDLSGGPTISRSGRHNDSAVPARSTTVRIRMCDYYAWELATLEGAPAFDLSWPESRRDNALISIADFLRRKGPR
jgi:hypothetical protein